MSYYKSQSNEVFWYDEDQVEGDWVKPGLVEMTPQEVQAHLASANTVSINKVSMRQARLALLQEGYLLQVEGIIQSLPSPQKEAAMIEWEYATSVVKDSPLVSVLASGLDLTSTELDELFTLANTF
jgi:hypothetical protein